MNKQKKPGTKVQILHNSGVDSGKIVTVVARSKIKTDGRGIPTNVAGASCPVDWSREVAFQYDNGTYGLMFKNRLKIVKPDSGGEASPAPERPSRSDEPPSPYHLDNITEGSKSVSLLPL